MKEKALFFAHLTALPAFGLFPVTFGKYLYDYICAIHHPSASELLGPAYLAAFISIFLWITVAGLALTAKDIISKKQLILLCFPAVFLGVGFVLLILYGIFFNLTT